MTSIKLLLSLACVILAINTVSAKIVCFQCTKGSPPKIPGDDLTSIPADGKENTDCDSDELDEDSKVPMAEADDCYYAVWLDEDGEVTSVIRNTGAPKGLETFEAENKEGDLTFAGKSCDNKDYCNGAMSTTSAGFLIALASLLLVRLF